MKKGNYFTFICYESNITSIHQHTWWIDSRTTIHACNTIYGMQNLRRPMGSEHCIYSRSKMSSHVEAIETCSLIFSSGFILCLENIFCVPSFDKNLIFILRFAPLSVSFNFIEYDFTLLNKSKVIGFCELCDGLYSINLQITLLIVQCMFLLG